jgi:hypothetical protein
MTASGFHRPLPPFSGNKALDRLGESLSAIRKADDLTWNDVGRVLGKNRETAAGYGSGEGDMGVVSFLAGVREWNGRFANPVLALVGMKIVPLSSAHMSDAASQAAILRAAVVVADELAADGDLSDDDLRKHHAIIEAAGAVFDGWRERLRAEPDLSAPATWMPSR